VQPKSSRLSTALVKILQRHRLEKKISRQALAEKAGLHQTAVGLIERGLRTPSVDSAHALATAMGIPLSKLIREAEQELTTRQSNGR
jgi:transcriptional regulator with XRE-family HTH domain